MEASEFSNNLHRLKEEIEAAQGESLRAFGSDKLLIEKYFESIRHVEVMKKYKK